MIKLTGVVHEFCNIAGLEIFNNCKEDKQQLVVEDCLDESLGVSSSLLYPYNIFTSVLCRQSRVLIYSTDACVMDI